MKALISKPVNGMQREFNVLCEKGGGLKGGPARGKVLELLKSRGKKLNGFAFHDIRGHFDHFPQANPWHLCFAMGLVWGHLAKLDLDFSAAAVAYLEDGALGDLKAAGTFCLDRGPDPITQSLEGGRLLFGKVTLPSSIPDNLERLSRAQERWFSPIINTASRPRYIGAWNATAMFMSAVFAKPELATGYLTPKPLLPPGGPIANGLNILHEAGVLSRPSAGNMLDDAAFEPGAIYENNALFEELCKQAPDWNLLDVHSGVYLLGTKDKLSSGWGGD